MRTPPMVDDKSPTATAGTTDQWSAAKPAVIMMATMSNWPVAKLRTRVT